MLLVGKRFETPHLLQDNNGRLGVGTERLINHLFDDRLGFRHAARLAVLLQDDGSAQFLSEKRGKIFRPLRSTFRIDTRDPKSLRFKGDGFRQALMLRVQQVKHLESKRVAATLTLLKVFSIPPEQRWSVLLAGSATRNALSAFVLGEFPRSWHYRLVSRTGPVRTSPAKRAWLAVTWRRL